MNKADSSRRRILPTLACCAALMAASDMAGADVTFSGLSDEQETNARALVRLERVRHWPVSRTQERQQRLYRRQQQVSQHFPKPTFDPDPTLPHEAIDLYRIIYFLTR